jgi:hypothetical protein
VSPRQQLDALLTEVWEKFPCDQPCCIIDHPSHSRCRICLKDCKKYQRVREIVCQFRKDHGLSPTDPLSSS